LSQPRILIVRTSALGDIVHSLPVLTALRRNLPQARIGWVVEEAMAPLLDGHPDLDELLTVRTRAWRRRPLSPTTWGEMGRFWGRLERFAPEIVFDLMGNHKAGILAALTLADRRIGLDRASRREPSSAIWISEPIPARGQHVVDQTLSLVEALGCPIEPADFAGEKLLSQAPAAALRFLADKPTRYLLIHPSTGWDNKCYPPAAWGELARLMGREPGIDSWVAVGPNEGDAARQVVAASGGHARAVSAPNLAFLAALHRRAQLVLGGDTGPVHLAHALGAPVLCLMGPTAPDRNGPYSDRQRSLSLQLVCSFCYKRFDEIKPCLRQLSPERVAARARTLLARLVPA
jgi:lipopolysaccharide heptosyltransferase I